MAEFSLCSSGEGGEEAAEKMVDIFGPGQVDQTIRQAIQFCWMALPKDRKSADERLKVGRKADVCREPINLPLAAVDENHFSAA